MDSETFELLPRYALYIDLRLEQDGDNNTIFHSVAVASPPTMLQFPERASEAKLSSLQQLASVFYSVGSKELTAGNPDRRTTGRSKHSHSVLVGSKNTRVK